MTSSNWWNAGPGELTSDLYDYDSYLDYLDRQHEAERDELDAQADFDSLCESEEERRPTKW